MKKIFILLTISIFLGSCNDGDIIVTTFDFEDESLNNCGDVGGFVLYKFNNETNESISLSLSTNDSIFNMTEDQVEMAMGFAEKFSNPFLGGAFWIILSTFFGFIYSLISGLIFKRERQTH